LHEFEFISDQEHGAIEYQGLDIYPNVLRATAAGAGALSVAMQLTLDRVSRLRTTVERVFDAKTRDVRVSAAVFVPLNLEAQLPRPASAEVEKEDTARAWIRTQLECSNEAATAAAAAVDMCSILNLHLVYESQSGVVPATRKYSQCRGANCLRYPINTLRNIAWNYVRSPLVFLLDADMIPSSHDAVKNALAAINADGNEKRVYIFALWDTKCGGGGDSFDACTPTNFMLRDHPSQAPIFRTDSVWKGSTAMFPINYMLFFEPYFIGPTHTMPRYSEKFWYGNDKVQQVYELAASGFSFYVLPESVGRVDHWSHSRSNQGSLAATRDAHALVAEVVRKEEWVQVRDKLVCKDEVVRTNPYWQLTRSFYAKCGCADTRPRMMSKPAWQKKFGDMNYAGAH
jgi:hypothetical protein